MKSKILNVRISDKTYSSLAKFAALSDRSMSQICRYAIAALNSDAPIESREEAGESGSTTVSFRITEDDIKFVNGVALANSASVSDVVRTALSVWLSNNEATNTSLAINKKPKEVKNG
jgi:hypothetical protein